MEVYFKKENGKLLRGVGDMDAKTDTAYFISGINYSDKEAFNKVDCGLIGWKLNSDHSIPTIVRSLVGCISQELSDVVLLLTYPAILGLILELFSGLFCRICRHK
jgi:hypothetical protein